MKTGGNYIDSKPSEERSRAAVEFPGRSGGKASILGRTEGVRLKVDGHGTDPIAYRDEGYRAR